MLKVLAWYYFFSFSVVLIGLIGTFFVRRRRKRLRRLQPPAGYVKTEEVSTDPTTGIVQRVWYNPATGERFYQDIGRESARADQRF
jgi:hypothetical protein